MTEEYRAICKDCNQEFGYSEASLQSGGTRGLSRPERCPNCRRIHSRESCSIGIPQIKVKPTGPRRPDRELSPGRLGKISHPERPHRKIVVESIFSRPDSTIEFGITDEDIRHLIKTMHDHQVTIVVGPTGSGKSTFLPYRLMVPPEGIDPDIFTRYGQIVVTQPRIQATRNIARFVTKDLHGSSLGAGFDVGFRHSNAPASDWRNKLVYITDGTLINWIVSGQISNLSVIMIDEAHERSLNIDLILGLLKQQLPRFPDFKLIIASATINADLFQGYFGGPDKAALIQFRGLKQHRIDAFFPFHDDTLKNDRRVPGKMAEKIKDILISIEKGEKSEGDILGFLQGEGEIDDCVRTLRQSVMQSSELHNEDINIYPLYSGLQQADQDLALKKKAETIRDKVLTYIRKRTAPMPDKIIALLLDHKSASETKELVQKGIEDAKIEHWTTVHLNPHQVYCDKFPGQILFTTHEAFSEMKNTGNFHIITDRRVIISTNLAETSLTVDGIVYVVDSGLIKESRWDAKNSAGRLVPVFHSRAGCRQRWGRAGRVRDGEAHMLYTDGQLEDEGIFPAHTIPEIQRSSLEEVILKCKAAGVDDISAFDWIQEPPFEELERAPIVLTKMGALDHEGDLTGYGAELQSFASEVPIASLLVTADQYACGVEMATFAAMSKARAKGGFLAWDKRWDFATRHDVAIIQRQFSEACRDDLEFFLKVYSLWAETMDPEIRAKACKLFFINEEEVLSKVAPARNKFMEMLSIAKKVEEDRAISFASLDRLRILLAVSLPKEFVYQTDDSGVISVYGQNGHSMPLKIDESSVLVEKPPSCFLAFSRRIITTKNSDEELLLSGLVRLEPEWLSFRGYSTIQLATAIAGILTQKRESEALGRERCRLFLDVLYPVGTRYRLLDNNQQNLAPGEKIDDPEPVQPVFKEGVLKSMDFLMPDAERDADPLAGWADKEDRQIPYDAQEDVSEANDLPDHDETFIPEDQDDNRMDISDNNQTSPVSDMITAFENGFITIDEIRAAREIVPIFRYVNQTDDGNACEVVGHDFSNIDTPTVILKRCSAEQQKSTSAAGLEPGKTVQVKGIALVELSNDEKALRVKETKTGTEYIVDARDLTFSGRWNFCEMFLGKEFEMMVEQRQGGLRLSRLPLLEREIQTYLLSRKREKFSCRLVERENELHYFILNEPEEKFFIEGAKMRLPRNLEEKVTFEIGESYDLYLSSRYPYGETHEYIEDRPPGLPGLVKENRHSHGIFWNVEKNVFHTKKPMTKDLKRKLETLGSIERYQQSIARLYRHSNKIMVWFTYSQGYLEKSDAVEQDFFRQGLVREYTPGEKVSGRISEIGGNGVFVVLDKGGKGRITKNHLCWKGDSLIDPREVVSCGQSVECTVLKYQVIKADEGTPHKKGRILIDLSLLDPDAFPMHEYSSGSEHRAKIVRVDDTRKFTIAELGKGWRGILPARNISRYFIKQLSSYMTEGEEIDVIVKKCSINPKNLKKPVQITLSLKNDPVLAEFKRFIERYQPDSIHQGRIIKIEDSRDFALIELEQGIVGILYKSDITYRRFDHVSDYLEREQRIQVKIKKCDFDSEDPERPFRIKLSHKDAYSKEKDFSHGKMDLLMGADWAIIRSLQEQSGCSIKFAQNSSFVTITGNSEESIEKAFQMIDRHLSAPREKAEWIKKDDTERKYTTSKAPTNVIKTDVIIPRGKCFLRLIGKGGDTVRRLNRESGCKIHCSEGLAEIDGPSPENIKTAFSLIQKIIPKAIMRDRA